LSRAGMLAAAVTVFALLVALRRQRLFIKCFFVLVSFLAIAAVLRPQHFDEFLSTFSSNVIYKGRQEGIFHSRRSPWEQTVAVIKVHPWFGSGFGTSDMGQFAEGMKVSLAPAEGGLYSKEGANREHGNSYLALAEYVGLLGLLPFSVLLFLLARMVIQVVLWMRRTSNPRHCAVPLAAVVLGGMTHAFFEDWLFAVGYYLCVFFWVSAFWLADLMPEYVPSSVRTISTAHPQGNLAPRSLLSPSR
jgi:O-antigen ligase